MVQGIPTLEYATLLVPGIGTVSVMDSEPRCHTTMHSEYNCIVFRVEGWHWVLEAEA
jgi:hypothetical protein